MNTKKKDMHRFQQVSHPPTRRTFLRDGLLAAGAIGFGIRKVLAQARLTGKPALTAAAVNRLSSNSSEAEYREICREAQKDLKAFVRKTFYLTPEQEKTLQDLTPEHVRKIQGTLSRSLANKRRYKMVVTYVSSPGDGQSRGAMGGFTVLAVRDLKEQLEYLEKKQKSKEVLTQQEEAQKDAEEAADSNFFEKRSRRAPATPQD